MRKEKERSSTKERIVSKLGSRRITFPVVFRKWYDLDKEEEEGAKVTYFTRPVLVYQEELLSVRQTQYYTRHTTWSVLSVFFICLHNKDCNQCLFFLLPPQYFLTPLFVSFWWKLCWSLYFSITITLQCLFVLGAETNYHITRRFSL